MRYKYFTYNSSRVIAGHGLPAVKNRNVVRAKAVLTFSALLFHLVFYGWLAFGSYRVLGLLRVREIEIAGNNLLDTAQVLDCAQISSGMNMLQVRPQRIKAGLTSCKGVADATVELRLPNKVKITLTERMPAALWWHDTQLHVVDREGVVIESGVKRQSFANLVLLIGPKANQGYTEIVKEVELWGFVVTYMQLMSDKRWDLRLSDGTILKLPEHNAALAVAYWGKLNQENALAREEIVKPWVVDLRFIPEKLFIKPYSKAEDE